MKKRGNILIILAIVAALAAVAVYVRFKPFSLPTYLPKPSPAITPQPTSTSGQTQTFQAKFLKFGLKVPTGFQITDTLTYIDLIKGQSKINISKNSTNYSNVIDYVKDFDDKRIGVHIENEEMIKIGDLNSLKRIENFTSGPISQQKIYYILVDSKVYSISTTSQILYDELDQIAQSFRYTP